MFSIQVKLTSVMSGYFYNIFINHFDTIQACKDYFGTQQWGHYVQWIRYWSMHNGFNDISIDCVNAFI